MIKLAVLGATGSIGENALNIAAKFPDKIEIVALGCGRKVEHLAELIRKFKVKIVSVADADSASRLKKIINADCRPEILWGPEGASCVATESSADTVLSAIVGEAGLVPTFAAIKAGLKIALANKEALVLGGEILMPLAKETGAEIIPVDSEHSAIFQVLGGRKSKYLRRLILTASGGPFRGLKASDLKNVSLEESLKHPRWSMGPKISCDSATMMNKGLEIIEAHHLFGVPYDKIEVLIHPQSLIHSIVEYIDGSQLMQAGPTDMRLAIAYALSHPERWPLISDEKLKGGTNELLAEGLDKYEAIDLENVSFENWIGHLSFEKADYKTFSALALAEKAGRAGGTAPAILSSANEEAVGLFLAGQISFSDISLIVEKVMNAVDIGPLSSIEHALKAAALGRKLARNFAKP